MVLFYSTFFFFFFLAELLDTWLWRWVAFLIVFAVMVVVGAVLALLGYLKVRRIRGPRETIESVKETRTALTPGHDIRGPAQAHRARTTVPAALPPIPRVGRWPTGSVGDPHRRAVAPYGCARQRHPVPRRRSVSRPAWTRPTPATARPGDSAARFRLVLVVLASSAARTDRCRVVAVDLRGYGGSEKPPRGYDGWTLAGDTAGLIRALGHSSATLIGHADGGLACWTTAVLHSRLVCAIA